jgi:hypothetical protein
MKSSWEKDTDIPGMQTAMTPLGMKSSWKKDTDIPGMQTATLLPPSVLPTIARTERSV